MRPRWLRSVGITIGALALCSLFYGHHYSSLISAGSSRTPREGVGYDLPSKSLEWIPAVSHGRERNREKTETLRVQRPSKEQVPDTCPTSLQLRVKNDSYFNTLFNFEVPLLLWNSHMTARNWDTLGKRPVPYGWKDLPQEDVASTLKLLNDSAHRVMFRRQGPQKCIRCAVVGNGGILNGSRKGKEIDGHDYVFRLNGAVIKGFEKDVGTKTSFYGFTVNTMKNSLISYNEYGFTQTPKGADLRYIFIPSDLRDYVMLRSGILGVQVPSGYDKGDKPSVYFGPKPSPRKFKMLHPDFLLYTRERFLKSDILNTKYAGLYMPSTGGLMLLTALHSCDQVSAYGFITPDYNRYSDHYYELQKIPLEFYANHDMILEMQLWGRLHDKGIIKLYKR